MFLNWKSPHKIYKCVSIRSTYCYDAPVWDRHIPIPGFSQEALSQAKILVVGAGGIGGEIGEGLVRKGVGFCQFVDGDHVEVSNLNRQFFYKKDLGKNKAVVLVRNLSKMGFLGSKLLGTADYFENSLNNNYIQQFDLAVCGVDNN